MKINDLINQINAYKDKYGDDVLNLDVCINNSFNKADASPLLDEICILVMKDDKPTKFLFTLNKNINAINILLNKNNYSLPFIKDSKLYYVNPNGKELEIKMKKEEKTEETKTKNVKTEDIEEATIIKNDEKKETENKKNEKKPVAPAVKPVTKKDVKPKVTKTIKAATAKPKVTKTTSNKTTKTIKK